MHPTCLPFVMFANQLTKLRRSLPKLVHLEKLAKLRKCVNWVHLCKIHFGKLQFGKIHFEKYTFDNDDDGECRCNFVLL